MKKLTRREFLGAGAVGLAAASQLNTDAFARPARRFDAPISFQSWGMKDQLSEDWDGTMARVREIGYSGMEMCSPRSYGQFAFLKDVSGRDLRARIENAGLFCKTCHMSAREVVDFEELYGTIEYAKDLGLENITMSSAGLGGDATLDDWKEYADKSNQAGEVIKGAGLQLVYHNHQIDPVMDGIPLYDRLMSMFDADLVKMQFQLASIRGGYDIVEYLDKYAGRYISLHMHDWDPDAETIAPLGDGIIDWKRLVRTAMKSNIPDHGWIVEIETDAPFEGLVRSYDYFSKLEV
ncbi:MAG: sugar phosphate isomerase/epimerase [Rhodothermales bacterium]